MNKKYIPVLSILALGIFVIGAYAAKAEPIEIRIGGKTITFLPLVIKSQAAEAPSGELFVFPSTTSTDGNPGGRAAMQNLCYAEDPDSHFCYLQEIEDTWPNTGVHFSNPFPESWVDNPDLSGITWDAEENSCDSWLTNTSGSRGAVIYETAETPGITDCDQVLPLACCKWMP